MPRLLLCFCLLIGLAPAPAARAADCPVHVVGAGDTLRKIAERYLGSRDRSPELYALNRRVVGPDPNLIEKGMRIRIPCTPDPGSAADADADADAVPPPDADAGAGAGADVTAAVADASLAGPSATAGDGALPTVPAQVVDLRTERPDPQPAAAPVQVLTGGPYAPFAGAGLPGGGLVVELAAAAYLAAGGPEPEIAFVNDRPAHLAEILPRGGFHVSLPWVYPDCAAPALDAVDAAFCDRFTASDSLYELVTEFYARADAQPWASVTAPADLRGARLCRPAGYPTSDLRAMGLWPDGVALQVAADPADCLRRLDRGEVDVISLDATVTRAIVNRIGLENPLVVLEALTRIDQLRAVALRGDPAGEAALARLDRGIERLVESGTWFEIVRRHLDGTGG